MIPTEADGGKTRTINKTELESMAANLINSSNVFVTNLGQTTERNSQNLTLLTVVGSKTNGYENQVAQFSKFPRHYRIITKTFYQY